MSYSKRIAIFALSLLLSVWMLIPISMAGNLAVDDPVAEVQSPDVPAASVLSPAPDQKSMQEILSQPLAAYTLEEISEVDGRQGVAAYNGEYWVSGSKALYHYNSDWELIASNESPFEGMEGQANHIGDIDVYKGEIYAPVEWFEDGVASSMKIAIYDAESLTFSRAYDIDAESGQTEMSGIAVDPDNYTIWLCSWAEGRGGRYLYKYNLDDGAYLGRVHLQLAPAWLQGIVYHDGFLYMTADDGDADLEEADHVYKWQVNKRATSASLVSLEMAVDDAPMKGEIEGLTFTEDGSLLICHNHGARIVDGIPTGFYDGFDKEIHEVLQYHVENMPYIPDYSDTAFWVARPEITETGSFDVFMVEPVTNMKNLSIGNENILSLRTVSRFSKTFMMEKGVFGEDANIYCPLYRQKLFGTYIGQSDDGAKTLLNTLDLSQDTEAEDHIAYTDVREAFLWYLEHKEDSRPFILFGYSQGGEMAIRLLEEFGEEPSVKDHLAATYAIGWHVTDEDLLTYPQIKMAQSADDTGVVICFDAIDEKAQKPDFFSHSINPLNWKTDDTPAGKEENLGYVMADDTGEITEEVPEFCGAYLDPDTGILIVTDLDDTTDWYSQTTDGMLPEGYYHSYDINFFYRNLEKNITQRIQAFH